MNLVTCPKCGDSYYVEYYTTTTSVYYPPVYKNGKNINPDRNISTTHCKCITCGTEFDYQIRNGELINDSTIN